MTLHPDVIRDLLPLYLADEVSPATRALIEEHLAADPELARLARSAASEGALSVTAPAVAAPAGVERAAFEATRRLLRLRARLCGFAIAATLLPFSFSFDGTKLSFFLFEFWPLPATFLLATGVVLWIAYWRVSRRLRVTGL